MMTRGFAILTGLLLSTGLWAQPGTVNFNNRVAVDGIDAPVFDVDGVTKLEGAAFGVQLYAGPTEQAVGPVGQPIAFRVGSAAGYFNGGEVTIPTVTAGLPAYVQVRAWEMAAGPTYEAAVAANGKNGRSPILRVPATGGGGSPPAVAANLIGLQSFKLTVGMPPFFTLQPASVAVVVGGSVTLKAAVDGTAPIAVRWLKGGVAVPGATGLELPIANAQPGDAGSYVLEAANAFGTTLSEAAVVRVLVPPTIAAQPQGRTVMAGEPVTLAVAATGTEPLAYQWFFQGAPLPGATAATLTLTGVQAAQAGEYRVRVQNEAGSVLSDAAGVVVQYRLTLEPVTGGTIGVAPAAAGYAPGATVTLTATANANYEFTGWTGDAAGEVNPLTLAMNGHKSVGAKFVRTYALASSVTGQGTVTLNPPKARYREGEVVQVTAVPAADWGFANWTGSSTASTVTVAVTMDGDKALTAVFKPLRTLAVTTTGQGTVTRVPSADRYLEGTSVQLTATASNGWQFVQWQGAFTGAQNPTALVLDTNKTVTAVFKQLFTVQVTVEGQGTVTATPSQATYLDGTSVTLTAAGTGNYRFAGWSGDLTGTQNPATLVVNTNKTLKASFKTAYVLAVAADAGGKVTRVPEQADYAEGTSVVLTAVPEAGFAFDKWTGDATGSDNPLTVIMNGPKSIRATWKDGVPPTITITKPVSGVTENENATLTGTVSDNSGVVSARWERDGVGQGALTLKSGAFSVAGLKLHRGENKFRVLAKDTAGNEGVTEVTVVWEPGRILSVGLPPEVTEGKRVAVPIGLRSKGDVGGMTFLLRYNPAHLRDVEWTWSGTVGYAVSLVNLETPGEIRATFALPGTAVPAGTETLATVSFRVRSVPFRLNSDLELEIVDAADALATAFTFGSDVEDGSVSILKRRFKGDINTNNKLDVGDSSLIQRLVAGLDELRTWDVTDNDLNGDGKLDSGDVIRVLRAVVGLDVQPTLVGLHGVWSAEGGVRSVETDGLWMDRLGSLGAVVPPPELAVLTPPGLVGAAGTLVTVKVNLANVQGPLVGASFVLDYPTNALRLLNATAHKAGPVVPGSGAVVIWNVAPGQNNYATQTGRILFGASSATNWPGSNGVLAEFTFQVQAAGASQPGWPIRLSAVEITSNGYEMRALPDAKLVFNPVPPGFVPGTIVLGANGFRARLQGEVGGRYLIQCSSDLATWTDLNTVVNEGGGVDVVDAGAAGKALRFYRARQLD